jgi:hypothetical protein
MDDHSFQYKQEARKGYMRKRKGASSNQLKFIL